MMMVKPYKLNQMASSISKIKSILPTSLHSTAITYLFNYTVKLAGTAGIRIDALTPKCAEVSLCNKRHVQNHIGGLHACRCVLWRRSLLF